ncbi:hypothetical protein COO91_09404 (plasmid) [Nostoc flagelliforme CCNUN1]|uniref:Uncharacterized protein n=1 Tax=Nostoc flagelliforme CCNUN1 TaxID=2038116 RepID=A0A2K8T6D8_9NOSO|nr:hypothetical protein COO91_09404 [Nostoc flagelliforme CCNUN1]
MADWFWDYAPRARSVHVAQMTQTQSALPYPHWLQLNGTKKRFQ